MQETVRAIVHNGTIEPLDPVSVPDGTEVLVTIVTNGDFWSEASESSLAAIWNNPEDDIYADLLER
jgi:predicted DNA-binding antitoxin AbrB/MazE fold protein